MGKFSLKSNARSLEVGWRVKLIAVFTAVAGHTEEPFWVRVQQKMTGAGPEKYVGVVEDYLTFVRAHGITQGFMLEFAQENICEIEEG